MIKPIETEYNGRKFRSRLEARWAVFFDEINTPYMYELEGYDLGGLWYLPDFFLPAINEWIEVKPILLNNVEMQKCRKFAEMVGSITALMGDLHLDNFLPYFFYSGIDGFFVNDNRPHMIQRGAQAIFAMNFGLTPEQFENALKKGCMFRF